MFWIYVQCASVPIQHGKGHSNREKTVYHLSTSRVASHISYCELYDENIKTKSSSFIIVTIPPICGAIRRSSVRIHVLRSKTNQYPVSMLVQSVQVATPTCSTTRLYVIVEKITYVCYIFVFKVCTAWYCTVALRREIAIS